MLKYAFLLFATTFFSLGSAPLAVAAPIVVAPAFYFTFGDEQNPKYESFQEAYARINPYFQARPDAVSGLVHWRASGVKPSGRSINGIPYYDVVLEKLEYNYVTRAYDTWVDGGTTGGHVAMRTECPRDFTLVTRAGSPASIVECVSIYPYSEPCDPCDAIGNPIFPSTYTKSQREVDYRSEGPGGLQFTRTYRSDRNGWEHNYSLLGEDLKRLPEPVPAGTLPPPGMLERSKGCLMAKGSDTGWLKCFGTMPSGAANDFALRRGNGAQIRFGNPSGLTPAAHINDRWTPIFEAGVKVGHDVYNASSDSMERYGLDGLVQRITHRNGQVTRFSYIAFDGPLTPATPKVVLESVTDHFGRKLTFTYNAEGRLETMTTPANEVYTYRYDEASSGAGGALGRLTSVTYPDQSKRIYWYNEAEHTAGENQPFSLTGITDEKGVRFATYKYFQGGFARSTEHAGGVSKYAVNGSSNYRTVVDPLGATHQYEYAEKQGGLRLISKIKPAAGATPVSWESHAYDGNGNLESLRDYNGAITRYTYDLARNLELTRTEAFGLPEQRTTTTEWHPTYRLVKRIAEPKRRTIYEYHPNGELKSWTIQATTDRSGAAGFTASLSGIARTWTYAYNAQWQLASVTGPVTTDITTYAYDAVTGDLQTVTNAAGHVTRFEEYDGNGRAGLITQPNGVKTRMRYSPRGWLESMMVSDGGVDLVTTYSYDNVGQLKTVTMPSRSVITYTYDDAHRLTDVADAKGNKIHYVLDNMGNRISEEVTDPSGNLRRQLTREFDALNRLRVQTGGAQ